MEAASDFVRDLEAGIYFDPEKLHILKPRRRVSQGSQTAQRRVSHSGLAGYLQAGASEARG
jgi:hypothetical protein